MPSITENQQDYCKLAQFSRLHQKNEDEHEERTFCQFPQINNVNLKILSNKTNKHFVTGSTPLHIACLHKNVEAFNSLLERGADFTAINKHGETALHRAADDMFLERVHRKNADDIVEDELIDSVLTAHVKSNIAKNPRSPDVFYLGLTHFHIACTVDHLDAIQFFLNAGISVHEALDVNSIANAGYTALHFATMFCKYDAARLLLQHGANLRVADARGSTAVHVVIERIMKLKEAIGMRVGETGPRKLQRPMENNQKIARLFLNADQKLDIDNTGFCKLHAACTLSDSSLAKRFLQDIDVNSAISMNSRMWPGYTALHFAVQSNIEIAKLLIKNGADIGVQDAEGITPLDICLKKYLNLEDFYSILSTIPVFKDIFFSDNKTKLEDFVIAVKSSVKSPSAIESFFQIVPKDIYLPHSSPLWPGYYLPHLLIHFSRGQKLLLNFGDDIVTKQDLYGRNPLHLAFYQGKRTIVDLLLEQGLIKPDVIDNNGLSHLHIACERQNKHVVETLLSKGAKVNVTYTGKKLELHKYWYYGSAMPSGSTPLHIAVGRTCEELIRVLLKYGADVNATDDNGITPMHQFIYLKSDCRFLNVENIEELGDLMFSSRDLMEIVSPKIGLSHLHTACFANNEKAVQSLLKLGANVNGLIWSTDKNFDYCLLTSFVGYTSLHFAIANQNDKLIELLLNEGADILAKKPDGMTLLYDALRSDRSKMSYVDIRQTKFFIPLLAKDAKLRKRMEDDSGLTLLHIACYLGDTELLQNLLIDLEVNVNAQIHSDTPIWPLATPLHILIECKQQIKDSEYLAKLLLERGANVTLANDKGDTPVHVAWSNWFNRNNTQDYDLLRLLMKYHKDFNVNPINEEGLSHFHLACFVSNSSSVEIFLEVGVDVNLPVDYLNMEMTFQTPLRFMLESLNDTETRLQTIDILISYGAEINVEDENRLTPFLKVAYGKSPRKVFFEKLHKAGADINSTNINGESVLEILLESRSDITIEEVQFFGHRHLNRYNSINGKGLISIAACKENIMQKSLLDLLMEIPSLFTVDEVGRTPIHNLVANHNTNVTSKKYAYHIERFIAMGYDLDAQDAEGKTALHVAAYFCNDEALSGLVLAGADLNITDNKNKTTITILLEHRSQDCEDMFIARLANITRLNVTIVLHSIAMVLCDLELNDDDFHVINFFRSIDKYHSHCEGVMKEFEKTNNLTIGDGSLKLNDFLSETGAVASRPSMSYGDREAIQKFFESSEIKSFPLLHSVLKLQYRKSLKRLQLIDPATESLKYLVGDVNGFCLPDLCCRIILRFLSNTDVKKLIMSSSIYECTG